MKMAQQRVAIVGQGYVGLPLALELSKVGWSVVGIEVDERRFQLLSDGNSTVESVQSIDLVNCLDRNYSISKDFSSLNGVDIVVICVPTPLTESGKSDLTILDEVVIQIGLNVNPGTLIVNESTSYPGTLRSRIADRLKLEFNKELDFAVAPERIDPGNSNFSIKNTPRVIGALNKKSLDRALELYSTICFNIYAVSSPEVAEFSKLLENSFRLVNITLVNELAALTRKVNVSIEEVISAASTKPFGFMKFSPGIGIGGHCIPVDPIYLHEYAQAQNVELSLIKTAKMRDEELTREIAKEILRSSDQNSSVLVVGIAYKAGSADTRESPSIKLINYLRSMGRKVAWMDSLVKEWRGESTLLQVPADCGLVVLINEDSAMDVAAWLKSGGKLLDCTGRYIGRENVIKI